MRLRFPARYRKWSNLKDASDACLAVLTGFASCETSAFMVASHIAELAESLPVIRNLAAIATGS